MARGRKGGAPGARFAVVGKGSVTGSIYLDPGRLLINEQLNP